MCTCALKLLKVVNASLVMVSVRLLEAPNAWALVGALLSAALKQGHTLPMACMGLDLDQNLAHACLFR